MNKAKTFFAVTFTIIFAFIVILTLYYSKALKKKINFLYQLGTPVPRSENVEPDYAAIEIKFSSDDTKLITLLKNGNVELWDLETKTKKTVFNTDSLFSYCKSNNSIVLSKNNEVISLNIHNNDISKVTSGNYKFSSIDKDCQKLVLSKGNNEIEVWNLSDSNLIRKIFTELPIRNGLRISPDGNFVAAAEGIYHENNNTHETAIEVWGLGTGKIERLQKLDLRNHGLVMGVWNLLFSQDNRKLVYDTQILSESGVSISDLNGNVLFEKNKFDSFWTRALTISPDSKILASGDEKGNLVIWDLNTKEIKSYYLMGDVIESLEFSNDGTILAAGLANSTIQVFKVIKPSG